MTPEQMAEKLTASAPEGWRVEPKDGNLEVTFPDGEKATIWWQEIDPGARETIAKINFEDMVSEYTTEEFLIEE